jgi:hypothetical protein
MIALLRVRFDTNTNPGSVWPDQHFENWMQPLRQYSLANFWLHSARGLLDLSYTLYPPIVISDPRPGAMDPRQALMDTVAAAASTQLHPDWYHTDLVLMWFAQKTDYFGNGRVTVHFGTGDVLSKELPVTVVDTETPFDAACQELGHSYGFDHEVSASGGDYQSPYSVMSARGETGRFLRPSDPDLPDGAPITDVLETNFIGRGSQRVIGPAMDTAQLHRLPLFRDSGHVIKAGPLPARHRVYASNYRVTQPPGPLPVLVTFASNRGDGRLFAAEVRRGGYGYDAAIGTGTNEPAAVVVHSYNPDGRVRYEGRAPLSLAASQTDWPCPAGDFSLRLNYVDPGEEFVDLEVRAGAQRYFPIRGVLLTGRFRTQRQLNDMSHDAMRNTLIVELTNRTNQNNYQGYDNDTLAGIGAVLVYLRVSGIRDDAALKTMSADDMRNTLITVLAAETGQGVYLQALSNMDLVLVGLGSDKATKGQVPGWVSSYIRGVLLYGGFRTLGQLELMDREAERNTLIVELTGRTNQSNYQGFDNAALEGIGAVMVTLREAGIRSDAQLKAMTADDMRNTLIVELDLQTKRGQALQGFTNMELVRTILGVERP